MDLTSTAWLAVPSPRADEHSSALLICFLNLLSLCLPDGLGYWEARVKRCPPITEESDLWIQVETQNPNESELGLRSLESGPTGLTCKQAC